MALLFVEGVRMQLANIREAREPVGDTKRCQNGISSLAKVLPYFDSFTAHSHSYSSQKGTCIPPPNDMLY